ncbi:GHKL domain-containing protein [Eubacterium sp. 1001713B170207_170306_E7]|uniref:GHKL domain-containing protein n=1 Tax=Eubacterium sp. 1001713B170207_170306_E7 TaxID=2787097 RepID=UPI00189A9A37|nr:GHKL domain-containing protein [Eubacterium sp. 1001713B170207_170306_E7]
MNDFLNANMFVRYLLGFWFLVAPVAFICLLPFDREEYRIPLRKMVFFGVFSMVILSFAETAVLVRNEALFSGENAIATADNLVRCITMLICLTLYFYCVRSTAMKKLLVYAMGFTYAAFTTALGTLYSNVNPRQVEETGVLLQDGSLYFYIALDLLLVPAAALFMRRQVRPALRNMDSAITRKIGMGIILMMMIYGFSFATVIGARNFYTIPMLTVFFSLSFCVFFSFALFFSIVRQSSQTMKAREEAHRLARQIEIDALSYRKMMGSIEQARAVRHDVRHHMRQIGSMLQRGDHEGAEAYTQIYMERMDAQSQITVCQNYLVNNIVLYYLDLCQKDGIELRHHIVLPELSGISPVDLTVLFSNILENALNACRLVTESPPFIELRSECVGASLVIVLENSLNSSAASSGNGSGIGMKSVDAIARAHDGEAYFGPEDGLYITKISLCLE